MRPTTWLSFAIGALALVLGGAAPAAAQATRTWVSGVGDDANPCSRTAPCKTFAGAISKTAAKGTISVLDPGGFGALTITKSINIATDQSYGGILSASTNGITINAGALDTVTIDGLSIDGAGTGLNGVRFLAGRSLTMTNCAIRGHLGGDGVGIDIAPTAGSSTILISNCTVSGNNIGVRVQPTGSSIAAVFLDRVIIERSGVRGVFANGGGARVRVNNSLLFVNANAFGTANGGTIASFGNNAMVANSPDGVPTSMLPLK